MSRHFTGIASWPLSTRNSPLNVPAYITKYAPMVHLHSTDQYRPADISAHLTHTHPEINFANVSVSPIDLNNLNSSLSNNTGSSIYLTSTDDITTKPSWLKGVTPNSAGETEGATACAIVANDHGAGLVDVFYMYFYAFDYGGKYFGYEVGDHVGDWEHSMVRFQDEVPVALWYSQHANGEAFTYEAVEKYNDGLRPIVYSATGTHANYATSGTHDHTIPNFRLPFGPIKDFTDKGPLWDPTISAYYYAFDPSTQSFDPADHDTPSDWLNFTGHWGDQRYPDSDPRQSSIFSIHGTEKYNQGPTGPVDKQLNRTNVCPDNGNGCILRTTLVA